MKDIILLFRKNREFRLLFSGQFISLVGTMMASSVTLTYQVYHLTGSVLWVGLLSLSQLIPLLVTALLGGALADRYNRRRLLVIAELLLSIGCLLLALNAMRAQPSVLLIFIIASTMSAINGLHRPALESSLQQVVPKRDMGTASTLSNFKMNIAWIFGPALGGLIIAYLGVATAYIVDLLTFAISLVCLWRMAPLKNISIHKGESLLTAIFDGFRYAMSRQELIGTYVVDFVAMIFGMPNALFPAIAAQFGGAQVLGLFYSAPALGALLASFYPRWTTTFTRHGAAVAVVAALWGMSIILFGLMQHLWLALFFLLLAGAFDGISGIFRLTMWNQTIPEHFRGRLAGIEMISYLSGPRLGDAEAGIVASIFSISTSVVSGGIFCILGVVLCCWKLPKFWQYRAPLTDD